MKLNQPRPAHLGTHPEPTEAEIQKAAYYFWQKKGCPDGNELDTWLEARELLRHHAAVDACPPPGTHPVQVRTGSVRPETVKSQVAIHFPTPHSTAPFAAAGLVTTSAHLDFRHSTPPLPDSNPPLRKP